MSVSVTGGAGGITANLDDLAEFSLLMRSSGQSVDDALEQVNEPAVWWSLGIGADREPVASAELHGELTVLAASFRDLRARLQSLARSLIAGIEAYHRADSTVLGSVTHAFGELERTALRELTGQRGSPQLFSVLPGLTDLTMVVAGWLERPLADTVPDGHAVLHEMGAVTVPAPRDLGGLIDALAVRNRGRDGEISVSFVVGADGRRRVIVDIPGTKSWNPLPNHDVTSVGTDIRALLGRRTSYEDGIFAALASAGVSPHEDVMLVGHSEGGIVAIDAAHDARGSGRFHITHVITAGAPIGRVVRKLPSAVQVLALENSADVVPHFDAATNPDRPNITTVTVDEQHDSIAANHDLSATYEPAAIAAEHSCNASVNAFTQSAQQFLNGTAMDTHVYRITRV